ncbi:MAG: hypothetical protein Q9182_005166 [Xanthomendoza sp. 2 TL-2023]
MLSPLLLLPLLLLLARHALSSPNPQSQTGGDALNDTSPTNGTGSATNTTQDGSTYDFYGDLSTNSTNSTSSLFGNDTLDALLESTNYFDPNAKLTQAQGEDILKAAYQREVALVQYRKAHTQPETLTPEEEAQALAALNSTFDPSVSNGTYFYDNGTFIDDGNATYSDGNGTYFANGTYIDANGTAYDYWNDTLFDSNGTYSDNSTFYDFNATQTDFNATYLNYTADPTYDPCGPKQQDGTLFDTCTVDPDGRPNVNGSALVYYDDYPGVYSVNCLPFPQNLTAGDNSSFAGAPMRDTKKLNLTACEASYQKFCSSIQESEGAHPPTGQWIWNDWSPGCAMGMWLPGNDPTGRAPYPDKVRCEYGIFRMMALECGQYEGEDSQIASVNVARFQGNGSTGVQVNAGYPSYIISPEVLTALGVLAYDQSQWANAQNLGGP